MRCHSSIPFRTLFCVKNLGLVSANVSGIFREEGCVADRATGLGGGDVKKVYAGVCGMGAKGSPFLDDVSKIEEAVEGASEDVIEISGAIKWFDAAKGYGFIIPDEGTEDILLHVTVLRRDGFQTAYEGARVVCQVLEQPKGLQAFRILEMDESTAVHPSQLPQRTHVKVTPESEFELAEVKWFNKIRGYGFLTRGSDTPDVFVHMETLRRFGFTELRPGQKLYVRYGNGPKGLMAAELKPDLDSKVPDRDD